MAWGVPARDDRSWSEFLIPEGAQAGLGWGTIPRHRESYRATFDGADPAAVAHFAGRKVEALLVNLGIIRNRLKVVSAVRDARSFLEVRGEYGGSTPTSGAAAFSCSNRHDRHAATGNPER